MFKHMYNYEYDIANYTNILCQHIFVQTLWRAHGRWTLRVREFLSNLLPLRYV